MPSLDMSKVPGVMPMQPPSTTTNKGSGRLLLQSPSAANARKSIADRMANAVMESKRELPNSEF